jgi:hypothetical protein
LSGEQAGTGGEGDQLVRGEVQIIRRIMNRALPRAPGQLQALHGEVLQLLRVHLEVLSPAGILSERGISAGLIGEQAQAAGAVVPFLGTERR